MSNIPRNLFIYFSILQLCFGDSTRLKIVNFHESCGDTINEEAGEIRFDAQQVPSYLHNTRCSVTFNPKSDVFADETRVWFYFTKFELSEFCADMNVTVIDGSLFGGTTLEGLPHYICGHNATLEEKDQFFTTKTDQLTVTFRGSNSGKYLPGNFTIKFIAFHTGECEDKGVFTCPNNHCVASKYACSDVINACGNDQGVCDVLKELQQMLELILKTIKNYIWVAAIIFALCILRIIYKNNKQAICRRYSSVRDRTRRQRNSNSNEEYVSVQRNEETVLTTLVPRESPQETISSLEPDEMYAMNNHFHSTNSDDVNMTSLQTPPPQYHEVMGNMDKYKLFTK